MKKQLALVITLCAHTALLPMFTAAIKSSRSLLPHINSCSKTTMLPLAHASSKEIAALAEQVAACKKLQDECHEKQRQLEGMYAKKQTSRFAQMSMGSFFVGGASSNFVFHDAERIIPYAVVATCIVGYFQLIKPSQRSITELENAYMFKFAELHSRRFAIIEPLVRSIECDAQQESNTELLQWTHMIRTTMEIGTDNNEDTREKTC